MAYGDFPADLLIQLDRSRPRGLRAQLERGLRQAIAGGSLPPGTALPPSRVLAAELGVSRSLVVGAYEQLIIEGYLEARQGSGTRVRARAARGDRAGDGGPANGPFGPAMAWRDSVRGSGLPDPALFPRSEWLRHYRDVLRDIPDDRLLYPHARGEPRAALAATAYRRHHPRQVPRGLRHRGARPAHAGQVHRQRRLRPPPAPGAPHLPGTAAAARHGVQLEEAARYWAERDAAPPALLVGYGVQRESTLASGLEALGNDLRELIRN